MTSPSISTGSMSLSTRVSRTPESSAVGDGSHFHIAIIGDFSGRGSRGDNTLSTSSPIAIDRDNFSQVFADLRVRLQLPFSAEPLEFADIDELHPDFLIEHLSIFERLKVLKNRLKKPELFAAAVAELQSLISPNSTPAEPHQDTSVNTQVHVENVLESIFASTPSTQQSSSLHDIDQFIKQLVAPYAQAKTDPRLPEMLAAVDEAIAQSLRSILHQSAFQELEANWRSLYFLVRRLETNSRLKIFIIDASRDALIQDAQQHATPIESTLYQILVSRYQLSGKIPFRCLQLQMQLDDDLQQLDFAANFAFIAASIGAIGLMGGSEKLAGCASLAAQPDVADWNYAPSEVFSSAWQAFRQSELSRHLAVVAPRFLLRLPYGQKTSPIETFDFTELPDGENHHYYLWGGSACLVSLVLAEQFRQQGSGFSTQFASQIDQLPLHTFHQAGEIITKPCAELNILDSAVECLRAAGLLVVRSIYGKNAVLIPALNTAAASGEYIWAQ